MLHAVNSYFYASIILIDPLTHETPSLYRDITFGTYDHGGIANLKYITFLTYTALSVEKQHIVNLRH